MIVPINDTHRLPYIKAKLTATKLGAGNTTPIQFFDQDEVELGFTIYTNSQGYICDSNGNLLGNGIFLHEDGVVTCTYNGAQVAQWVVKSPISGSDVQVNDGKMLNARGDVVWSANSAGNYTLKYSDLEGTPRLNEWSEDEQDIVIPRGTNPSLCTVNKHTKILVVGSELDPQNTPYTDLYLVPEGGDPQRFGQVFFLQNGIQANTVLHIMQEGGSLVCTLGAGGNAVIALLSDGKFVCLQASGGFSQNITVGSLIASPSTPFYFSDETPDVILITDNQTFAGAFAKCGINASLLSRTKKFILWWNPQPANYNTNKKLRIYGNATSLIQNSDDYTAVLQPFCPCEVLVSYNATTLQTTVTALGYIETRSVPVDFSTTNTLYNSGDGFAPVNVVMPSAATIVELGLGGGVQPPGISSKIVIPVDIEIPKNFRGDIVIKNSTSLSHLDNFEIQVGFRNNGEWLQCDMGNYSNGAWRIPVYRSNENDGANAGKFLKLAHVEAINSGGFAFIMDSVHEA